jgi:hypothetical protein
MGQPITVVEKPSSANPAVLRLETNRPLSGMGHERYLQPPGELLQRPVDELARRLFAAGGVQTVHINGSVITVTLGGGNRGEGLADVVRELFLHYGDTPAHTVAVPLDDADAAPDTLAEPGDAPSAQDSADDAPAPDRPGPEEPVADQQIEGIPNTELAPDAPASGTDGVPVAAASAAVDAGGAGGDAADSHAVSEREPSPADPAEVDAARASASPPSPSAPGASQGAGGTPEAGDGGPVVEQGPADAPEAAIEGATPEVERPEPAPLAADPADVEADDPAAG